MDYSPLWISLRTALVATVFAVIIGIVAAYYVIRLGRLLKGIADGILTLPMVLPPTVVGFFLLVFFGIHGPAGRFFLAVFHERIVFSWYAPIIASTVVAFPLMYRTMRGAFEQFDQTLVYAAQTLGLSNTFIFWRIILPGSRYSMIAGTVLAFARGLGEFGATIMLAGNLPGKTTTLSVAVYAAMAAGDNALAYKYVLIDLVISFAVMLVMNLVTGEPSRRRRKNIPAAKGGI
ncbi:molybdate transport system permease protein [Sporobacter termitidis DSM 10068]|uniref:Molybdenum transport system permease n=1 Tax=Sporobacter termitidis DSM 10068 TaxID=1123282 RepID=A0A1M5TX85_9FIRM|nr:molybdate ABC transporter permease subunit [Sporobacter termitidis]SHH55407.1 molybdate transport system permease protein [Sporobacter termitidis DSM 10068]